MKLLTVIISIAVSLTLTSCHNTSADAVRELEKLYPQYEMYKLERGSYLAIDSTGIYYIINIGFNKPKFCKTLIKKF